MARPLGTKVIPCPTKKCNGRIVAKAGEIGVCKQCGEKVKFTRKLLAEYGK